MATTIQKWGNSLGVRIPKKMAENAALSNGVEVSVNEHNGKITIVRAKTKKKLSYIPADLGKLLAKCNKKNRHPLVDWGPPQGREVW